MGSSPSVRDFFNDLSADYDAVIRRTIPPYQEIFEAVVGYTFIDRNRPLNILELGCGTGNLTVFVKSVFPHARLTLVDLSPEMLEQAAAKLSGQNGNGPDIELVEGSFMDVTFPPQSFDLIVSSIALHHLLDPDKEALYPRMFEWLKPGGLLRIADEVKTLPYEPSLARNLESWKDWSRQNGATEEELQLWVEHGEKYDHYASLHEHFRWMSAAGFTEVDCYWKKILWAVFGGQRPA